MASFIFSMKNYITFLIGFICFNANSQMLEAGDGVVELNLGFPNVMPVIVDGGGNFHGGFDVFGDDVKKFGQLGIKGEFLMADRIGIIAAINYGYFFTHSTTSYSVYDPNTASYYDETFFYDTKVHKFRITAGLNIHTVKTNRVDSYFGFMAGTKKATYSYETNDNVNFNEPDVFVSPIALRVHYGLRYFVNEQFAINFELGAGGPLICAGITYKVPAIKF